MSSCSQLPILKGMHQGAIKGMHPPPLITSQSTGTGVAYLCTTCAEGSGRGSLGGDGVDACAGGPSACITLCLYSRQTEYTGLE